MYVSLGLSTISRANAERLSRGMDKIRLSRHVPAMTPKTPHSSPNGSRIVEVLAFPSVQLLDVTGPIQVFASANNFMVAAGNAAPYAIRVVAHGTPSVEATAGVALAVHPLSPGEADVDTLVIAGGDGVHASSEDAVLVDWVRQRSKRARR